MVSYRSSIDIVNNYRAASVATVAPRGRTYPPRAWHALEDDVLARSSPTSAAAGLCLNMSQFKTFYGAGKNPCDS